MIRFAERLKKLRISKGLSQQALADQLGNISKSSINMYERGEREPGLEMLDRMATYFSVSVDDLLVRS